MNRKTITSLLPVALTIGAVTLTGSAASATGTNPYDTFDGTAATSSSPAGSIVGVGSDTTQIVVHDVAAAWNGVAANANRQLSSFAADGSPTSIFLRTTSAAAVTRPNGSGPGKASLFGAGNNTEVNFARSSSTLSTDEANAGLKQAAFAIDGLKIAVASTTNAPASLTPTQIVNIFGKKPGFTHWNDPGVGGTSPDTIKPFVPQPGSGTGKFFAAKLKEANGNVAVDTSGDAPMQEHDPSLIAGDANAIAPFSTARAASISTIKLLGGTEWKRAVYNVVRGADTTTLGDVFGPTGFFCSAAGRTAIEGAGFVPLATQAQGGKCGVWTTDEVAGASLVSFADAKNTTTSLAGAAALGGAVTLTATVGGLAPDGSVAFKEGATTVGTAAVNASGKAVLNLNGVSAGSHSYTATFVPSSADQTGSTSSAVSVTVVQTANSSTSASLSLSKIHLKKKQKSVLTAKVAVDFPGAIATGNVTISISLKGKPVKTLTAPLVSGSATATLPALKKGKYVVTVSYPGATNIGASSAAPMTLKVKP